MIKEASIIQQMRTFSSELGTYQYLQRKRAKREHITPESLKLMINLRLEALKGVGKLKPLITEITEKERATVIPKDGGTQYSVDLWLTALKTNYDKTADDAIDKCMDLITVAEGRLEQDIRNGKRDPDTGERIGAISTKLDTSIRPKAFIAHGGDSPALRKLESYLEALGVQPLVVEEQPSEGRSIAENVDYYARQSDFAIILATKGDVDGKTGGFIPRGNVLIEIGKLQEIFKERIVYLLQAGTKLPTNISEKVRVRFSPQSMDNSFIKIAQELKKYEMLGVEKETAIKAKPAVKVEQKDTTESPIQLFDALRLHPRIIRASKSLFNSGHYAEAIFAAFKAVNNFTKRKVDPSLDGKDLMAKAFNEDKPIIKINKLTTRSERDEQEGFRFLFMGAMVGIRNPKAHDDIRQISPYKTLEYLAFASLLMRRATEGKLEPKNK